MKKKLSLLTIIALTLCATTSHAKDVVLKPSVGYMESPVVSEVIAPGATLVNTNTGDVVVYNLNDAVKVEPPFDITKGLAIWGIELNNQYNEPITLGDVSQTATDTAVKVSPSDTLVLDFSSTNPNMNLGGPTDAEYMVLMFHAQTSFGNDFAEWYSTNEISIIGRFTNGDYKAYTIDDTCDLLGSGSSSTYGGLVFFNTSVAEAVSLAEVDPDTITPAPSTPNVPEPTTATLSLLALAGLAARRRRR